MKKAFFKNFELLVHDSVYEPREDSFLLAENIKARKGSFALDMGCGCGIQSIALALQEAQVIAADKSKAAVKNTAENSKRCGFQGRITAMQSNLFQKFEGQKFDCIVFNPPYLPSEGFKDMALDGGLQGKELLHKFLDKLPSSLNFEGVCFFVQSSLNCEKTTSEKLKSLELRFEVIARQKIFFEELLVFKVFL